MFDVTVHTIVRNEAGLAKFCLSSALALAETGLIYIDSRSNDGTEVELRKAFLHRPEVKVVSFEIKKPLEDLVRMRNKQIRETKTKWIWIVDSDEFYPLENLSELLKTVTGGKGHAFSLPFWSIWNRTHLHKSTSKRPTLRFVKNFQGLQWRGTFGKETLCIGENRIEGIELPFRYIHFTHVKKDDWRSDLKQNRTIDGKFLIPIPQQIISYTNKFFDEGLITPNE